MCAMLVRYLNIFDRIVRAALKLRNLKAPAPAQTELPVELTQFAFFGLFIMLAIVVTIVAVIKFGGEPAQPSPTYAS
jgi:hypothetical protein